MSQSCTTGRRTKRCKGGHAVCDRKVFCSGMPRPAMRAERPPAAWQATVVARERCAKALDGDRYRHAMQNVAKHGRALRHSPSKSSAFVRSGRDLRSDRSRQLQETSHPRWPVNESDKTRQLAKRMKPKADPGRHSCHYSTSIPPARRVGSFFPGTSFVDSVFEACSRMVAHGFVLYAGCSITAGIRLASRALGMSDWQRAT